MKKTNVSLFNQRAVLWILLFVSVTTAITTVGFIYYYFQFSNVSSEIYALKIGYSKKVWLPGEEVKTANFVIKINSATTDKVGIPTYLPAPDGFEFITLDMTIKNKTSDDLLFIPVNSTFLKDQSGITYSLTAVPNVNTEIAGNIPAGEYKTGQVGFLIPQKTSELKFYFEPYGTDEEKTIIIDLKQYL